MRTSESKDTRQLHDASAAFEPEVRNRTRGNCSANFGFAALVLGSALTAGLAAAAFAQQPAAPPDKAAKQQELDAVRAEQRKAADAEALLKGEIAALGEDRRKLNEALLTTAGRLRRPGVVAGREPCPKAPNGAPDCAAATLLMCRANGFESGSSIDMQTEEICPTATPAGPMSPPSDESECRLESYVIRALCR